MTAGDVPPQVLAVFSCASSEKSHESLALKHGVFFHYLIEGYKGAADTDHDGQLSWSELVGYLQKSVDVRVKEEFSRTQTVEVISRGVTTKLPLADVYPVADPKRKKGEKEEKEELGVLKMNLRFLDNGISREDLELFIDDRKTNHNMNFDVFEQEMKIGAHKIVMKRCGVVVYEKEVDVKPKSSGNTNLAVDLIQTGTIRLTSKVAVAPNVTVWIYLDGRDVQRWPVGARLVEVPAVVGTRTVEVRVTDPVKKVHFRQTVEVAPGKTHEYEVPQ